MARRTRRFRRFHRLHPVALILVVFAMAAAAVTCPMGTGAKHGLKIVAVPKAAWAWRARLKAGPLLSPRTCADAARSDRDGNAPPPSAEPPARQPPTVEPFDLQLERDPWRIPYGRKQVLAERIASAGRERLEPRKAERAAAREVTTEAVRRWREWCAASDKANGDDK